MGTSTDLASPLTCRLLPWLASAGGGPRSSLPPLLHLSIAPITLKDGHTVDHLHHLHSLEQGTWTCPSLVEGIVLGSLDLHLQMELGRILAKLGKESVEVGRKIIVRRRDECAVAKQAL